MHLLRFQVHTINTLCIARRIAADYAGQAEFCCSGFYFSCNPHERGRVRALVTRALVFSQSNQIAYRGCNGLRPIHMKSEKEKRERRREIRRRRRRRRKSLWRSSGAWRKNKKRYAQSERGNSEKARCWRNKIMELR